MIEPQRDQSHSVSPSSLQRVYDDAGRAAGWGLGINFALLCLKGLGGIVTGSSALLADAVNSLGDVASALAVRRALTIAQLDEDDDHPYGHSKAESIAGLSVALMVAFSASVLALETIERFGGDLQPIGLLAGGIAAACAVVKELAYRYTKRMAARLHSTSLRATALDHHSDAISSGVVAIALICSHWMGPWAVYVDPLAALFVCAYLIVVGIRMFASIAGELMDQQANDEVTATIRRIAEQTSQVVAVEKLRVRKSGLEFFAEIHVQVAGDLSVNEGHRIGHHVKDRLQHVVPRLRDVHIHIEPFREPTSRLADETQVD